MNYETVSFMNFNLLPFTFKYLIVIYKQLITN